MDSLEKENGEGQQRGCGQEGHLRSQLAAQVQDVPVLEPVDEDDHRPADADEEAVGAGHIGGDPLGLGGDGPGVKGGEKVCHRGVDVQRKGPL